MAFSEEAANKRIKELEEDLAVTKKELAEMKAEYKQVYEDLLEQYNKAKK